MVGRRDAAWKGGSVVGGGQGPRDLWLVTRDPVRRDAALERGSGFAGEAQRSQPGLRPQPKDVLTQRHEATKRTGEVRGPPQLRGFVALCETHASRTTFCKIAVQRRHLSSVVTRSHISVSSVSPW